MKENDEVMSQQQSQVPNQSPSHRSSIILSIVIVLVLVIVILGVYAIVAKQDKVISVILFILAISTVLVGILQVAPNILPWVQRSIKMSLLMIGILVLVGSLTINAYLLIHFWASSSPNANTSSTSLPTQTMTPTKSHLTPALVQKSFQIQSQETKSSAVTFPASVTAGNLIVVSMTQFKGTVSSVTDNHGNTYTQATAAQHANTSTDYVELYYAKNVTGGATTVTVTFSMEGGILGINEYSGLDTTSPLDQVTSSAGFGNTPNGGTLNTTKDNELYFDVGVDDNGNNSSPSAGSGYTLENHQDDSSNHERFYSEDRISAKGSYQTNFSIAAGSHWAVIGSSFKPEGTPTYTSPTLS